MIRGVRLAWLVLLVAGCDQLFGIQPYQAADAPIPPDRGCSDGTREGFADAMTYRSIAACAGAWSIMGLVPDPPVMCDRKAGNDGSIALGSSCTATDLCEVDWHVCRSRLEVIARLPVADRTCDGLGAAPNTLFVTAQSGPGGNMCADGTNDVFGCGTFGLVPDIDCAPLDEGTGNQCYMIKDIGGWSCIDAGSEVTTIFKTDPTAGGGVLCCRDQIQL